MDKSQAKEILAHYRGFVVSQARGWHSRYLDVGSKRFLSVPDKSRFPFYFLILFVYGSHECQNVFIEGRHGQTWKPWRLFVKGAFPYLGIISRKGSYKTLYFRFGFRKIRKLVIGRQQSETDILTCVEVPDQALFSSFEEISDGLEAVQEKSVPLSIVEFGKFERSIFTLDPKLTTQIAKKAIIELYCRTLKNHRTAHKLLKSWTETAKALGEPDEIKVFQTKLDQITFPLGLGRHGFNPSFKNLDLDSVESELHKLMKDFAEMGVQPFLNSGTLLGYYRDGHPIPHDDDFDLGILVEGRTEEDVAKNWREFVRKVNVKFNSIDKGSFLALKMSNGVQIDLFCAWRLKGQLFVHPYCWADVSDSALLPLQSHEVRGRKFDIPADPNAILSVNYGENWRVPDPFWRFDYKKSHKRFGNFLKKLKSTSGS